MQVSCLEEPLRLRISQWQNVRHMEYLGLVHIKQKEEGTSHCTSHCLAYGVFEGQQMTKGEDDDYESLEWAYDYEPLPN